MTHSRPTPNHPLAELLDKYEDAIATMDSDPVDRDIDPNGYRDAYVERACWTEVASDLRKVIAEIDWSRILPSGTRLSS